MIEYTFERLYLAKRNDSQNDVYVEKCPMIQHQLDGIRFLYQAFKKNKPGVILNDPSGYGKRVQVALFLSAILPTLDKPVLILCRDGSEQRWLQHFQEWTQISDEVAIEDTNPLVKKKVLVSASCNAAVFTRRDWSLLVVDDYLSKGLLKTTLRCGLKVWIHSSNIKEDLSQYAIFYSWLHPKEKFCEENFKTNNRNVKEVIAKALSLDAYLEDTVLRRTNLQTLLSCNKVSNQAVQPQVTRKNKDATGTKIKRSKRKLDSLNKTNVVTNEDHPTNEARCFVNDQQVSDNASNMEISLQYDGYNDSNENEQIQCNKRNKKSRVIYDSDSDDSGNKIDNNEITQQPLQYDSESGTDNNDTTIEKSVELDNINVSSMNTLHCSNNITNEFVDKSIIANEITLNKKEDYKDEIVSTANEVKSYESEIPFTAGAKNNFIDKTLENNTSDEIQNDILITDLSNENDKEEITESGGADNSHTKNEGIEKTDEVKVKSETQTLSSFDLKLKELEEKTLKKFKGSLFDRLF